MQEIINEKLVVTNIFETVFCMSTSPYKSLQQIMVMVQFIQLIQVRTEIYVLCRRRIFIH